MTAQIIHLCERRRRKVRHNIGTAAALEHALTTEPPCGASERVTRARLFQEAIDEAIIDGSPCDYESIAQRVREYERYLRKV